MRGVVRTQPLPAMLTVWKIERRGRGAIILAHDDGGRELILYLARQRDGLTLREVGAAPRQNAVVQAKLVCDRFSLASHRDAKAVAV